MFTCCFSSYLVDDLWNARLGNWICYNKYFLKIFILHTQSLVLPERVRNGVSLMSSKADPTNCIPVQCSQ